MLIDRAEGMSDTHIYRRFYTNYREEIGEDL